MADAQITYEEYEKLNRAMRKSQFRNLLTNYVDEISDKTHKEEQEEYMLQVEEQGEMPKGCVLVKPEVGCCVKLELLYPNGLDQKCFFNICHSPWLLDIEITKRAGGSNVDIPFSVSAPRPDKDKKGSSCLTFDVCVSTKTYRKCEENGQLLRVLVDTCVDRINSHYLQGNERIQRDFQVLQHVKCKGGTPPLLSLSETLVKDRESFRRHRQEEIQKRRQQKQKAGAAAVSAVTPKDLKKLVKKAKTKTRVVSQQLRDPFEAAGCESGVDDAGEPAVTKQGASPGATTITKPASSASNGSAPESAAGAAKESCHTQRDRCLSSEEHAEDNSKTLKPGESRIIHQGIVDLADLFGSHSTLPLHKPVPDNLSVEVNLAPWATSSRDIDVSMNNDGQTLKVQILGKEAHKRWEIPLPFPVDFEKGNAQFMTETQHLKLRLPVDKALLREKEKAKQQQDELQQQQQRLQEGEQQQEQLNEHRCVQKEKQHSQEQEEGQQHSEEEPNFHAKKQHLQEQQPLQDGQQQEVEDCGRDELDKLSFSEKKPLLPEQSAKDESGTADSYKTSLRWPVQEPKLLEQEPHFLSMIGTAADGSSFPPDKLNGVHAVEEERQQEEEKKRQSSCDVDGEGSKGASSLVAEEEGACVSSLGAGRGGGGSGKAATGGTRLECTSSSITLAEGSDMQAAQEEASIERCEEKRHFQGQGGREAAALTGGSSAAEEDRFTEVFTRRFSPQQHIQQQRDPLQRQRDRRQHVRQPQQEQPEERRDRQPPQEQRGGQQHEGRNSDKKDAVEEEASSSGSSRRNDGTGVHNRPTFVDRSNDVADSAGSCSTSLSGSSNRSSNDIGCAEVESSSLHHAYAHKCESKTLPSKHQEEDCTAGVRVADAATLQQQGGLDVLPPVGDELAQRSGAYSSHVSPTSSYVSSSDSSSICCHSSGTLAERSSVAAASSAEDFPPHSYKAEQKDSADAFAGSSSSGDTSSSRNCSNSRDRRCISSFNRDGASGGSKQATGQKDGSNHSTYCDNTSVTCSSNSTVSSRSSPDSSNTNRDSKTRSTDSSGAKSSSSETCDLNLSNSRPSMCGPGEDEVQTPLKGPAQVATVAGQQVPVDEETKRKTMATMGQLLIFSSSVWLEVV